MFSTQLQENKPRFCVKINIYETIILVPNATIVATPHQSLHDSFPSRGSLSEMA